MSKGDVVSDVKARVQAYLGSLVVRCPVGVYTHYKGGAYVVFAHSIDEASLVALVHYYSVANGTRWTRTITNFVEEVEGRPRFEHVSDVTDEMLARARGARGE